MNKELKDGLREPFIMKLGDEVNDLWFNSITELMIGWYRIETSNKSYEYYVTYLGEYISMFYDSVYKINGDLSYETDFISMRRDLEGQISDIHIEKDGE